MYEEITGQARQAVTELLEAARLEPGDLFVVGCSSSEVGGHKIGSDSSPAVAEAVFQGIYPLLKERGIYLAAQCCEHLNRAIILEKEAARAKVAEAKTPEEKELAKYVLQKARIRRRVAKKRPDYVANKK